MNYPNLRGNIPKSQAYGIFIIQLVRFSTINDNASSFIKDGKNMVNKLLNQGFDRKILIAKYFEFTHNYIGTWYKYGRDLDSVDCYKAIF